MMNCGMASGAEPVKHLGKTACAMGPRCGRSRRAASRVSVDVRSVRQWGATAVARGYVGRYRQDAAPRLPAAFKAPAEPPEDAASGLAAARRLSERVARHHRGGSAALPGAFTAILQKVPAHLHFISYEPALGPLTELPLNGYTPDWIIAGGESGPHHRKPDPRWFEDVRDECERCDVPFLFKQWGGRTPKAGGRLLGGVGHNGFPLAMKPRFAE